MAFGHTGGKTPQQLEYMREAGLVVAAVHTALREAAKPGLTTKELDQLVYDVTLAHDAKPNFLNYNGFSGSVCISVNEEIVHGIPGPRVLEPGDIVSFDCGAVIERGGLPWHGDAAFTVVLDGPDEEQNKKRRELSAITEHSMWAGIAAAVDAKRIGDISAAIEDDVEAQGLEYGWTPELLEGYTGHGIGNHLHEDPTVYNYRTRNRGPKIGSGTTICIEPMLTEGDQTSATLADDWTVVTVNGLASAHWEHTIAITNEGISVLTAPDAGAAGLAPWGITPIRSFV